MQGRQHMSDLYNNNNNNNRSYIAPNPTKVAQGALRVMKRNINNKKKTKRSSGGI